MDKNNITIPSEVNSLPVMMYIHGFRSGANGSKRQQLQKHFAGRYRVITPEVDADPEKSLALLNEIIKREKPAIIVGTSLGGWMTLMCDSRDASLVVVNPCLDPRETLGQWIGEELTYFCPRHDGRQTYTLTPEVLAKYEAYDALAAVTRNQHRLYALCSSNDELIGDSHIRALQPLLRDNHLIVAGDFGHRCSGPGMTHLFNILDPLTN